MWFQLEIDLCPRDEAEQISQMLQDHGAVSVTFTDKYDDAILEPELGTMPLWPHIIIHALFESLEEANQQARALTQQFPELICSVSELPDVNWELAWMDDFKPTRFGKRLWICPSWMPPPDPDAVNLILDPGLAFGTGTHPTTSLCLQWLDEAPLQGKSVIDFGCGSGILALAALKLGASALHAVDIDPQALLATKNNAESNQIGDDQLFVHYPQSLSLQADILIANILLTPLLQLQQEFHRLLKADGLLVVSGILSEQKDELINSYKECFVHRDTKDQEGWSLLVFQRLKIITS